MTPKARLSLFRKLIESENGLTESQRHSLRRTLKDFEDAIDFADFALPMVNTNLPVSSWRGLKDTSLTFIRAYERYLMIETLVKNKSENK